MYNRRYKQAENFPDKISRLFSDEFNTPETLNEDGVAIHTKVDEAKRPMTRTVTFQVTDRCNLCCTYCYQINKKTHSMSFDVAKKYADFLLQSGISEDNEYINKHNSPGLVIEFIGGEPLLEIDLIDQITDYFINKMIEMDHPWLGRFMISICSNGVLYMDPRVQKYITKHKEHLSFSISIDGNKQLHDSCRVFADGRGSYDIAIQGVEHYRTVHGGHMGSKMTLAPANIKYTYDAVMNLIDLKYDEIFLNCVFEEGWTESDATVLFEQLKRVSDEMIDTGLFEKIYLSIFEDGNFKPKEPADNQNWCGGTGAMLSCDYKGDLYPCIRYMESSLGDSVEPMIIGNVDTGIMGTKKQCDCVHCLRAITRRSQSTDECFYCPIAEGCAWCSAYNYQTFGTADHRATFICIMHKARALANLYYWNKGFRKYAPYFRMKNYVPDEWALKIISQEQLDEINRLAEFTEEDYEAVVALDPSTVDIDHMGYYKACLENHKPIYTNNYSPSSEEVSGAPIDKDIADIIDNIGDE